MTSKDRLDAWTNSFLSYVRERTAEYHVTQEEGYKFRAVETFQKHFDFEAADLASMLDAAIESNNLVMGAMYFPKKMLLIFARDYPEETRKILRSLYDESSDVGDRLDGAEAAFGALMVRRNRETGHSSATFMGLRFLSLLLSYRYPDAHNAMKPREWKVFCRYLDDEFAIPNHTPIGRQYRIFSEYVDALRLHIKDMPEMRDLRAKLTRGLAFTDEEFRWMAQDVIYVTAKRFAREKDEGVHAQPTQGAPTVEEDEGIEEPDTLAGMEMRFPLEKYLEHFMVENWDNIDFGEPLQMYRDEDGTPGQQYTTDVGIIDLLAKDKDGNFVVIELKRGKSTQHVMGQILAYIGWVRKNLATNGEGVRGIVIVSEGNQALLEAQQEVADKVAVKYYRVNLQITDPS